MQTETLVAYSSKGVHLQTLPSGSWLGLACSWTTCCAVRKGVWLRQAHAC